MPKTKKTPLNLLEVTTNDLIEMIKLSNACKPDRTFLDQMLHKDPTPHGLKLKKVLADRVLVENPDLTEISGENLTYLKENKILANEKLEKLWSVNAKEKSIRDKVYKTINDRENFREGVLKTFKDKYDKHKSLCLASLGNPPHQGIYGSLLNDISMASALNRNILQYLSSISNSCQEPMSLSYKSETGNEMKLTHVGDRTILSQKFIEYIDKDVMIDFPSKKELIGFVKLFQSTSPKELEKTTNSIYPISFFRQRSKTNRETGGR